MAQGELKPTKIEKIGTPMLSGIRGKISGLIRIIDKGAELEHYGVSKVSSALVVCRIGVNIIDMLKDVASTMGFVVRLEHIKDLFSKYPNPALVSKKTLIVVIPSGELDVVDIMRFVQFIRPYRNLALIALDVTGSLRKFGSLFDEVLVLDSVSDVDKRQLIKAVLSESGLFDLSDPEFESIYKMLCPLSIQDIMSILRGLVVYGISKQSKVEFGEVEKFISNRISKGEILHGDSILISSLYPKELLDQLYLEAVEESGDEFYKLILSLNENKLDEKMQKILLKYPFVLADKPLERLLRYHKAKQILERIKRMLE